MRNEVEIRVNPDGSVVCRRPFGKGTIAMMNLQFSSSEGAAFCVSAERVPQAIVYEGGKEILAYDDYNGVLPKRQDVVGTVTPMFGNGSPRHGWRIIEVER